MAHTHAYVDGGRVNLLLPTQDAAAGQKPKRHAYSQNQTKSFAKITQTPEGTDGRVPPGGLPSPGGGQSLYARTTRLGEP